MVLRTADAGRSWAGSALAFVAAWAVMWHVAPFSDVRITDLFIYERDAALLAGGSTPYSDTFAFEYPPLALIPMGLARALGGDYQQTFGLLMLVCGLACLLFVRALGGPLAAWAFALTPLLCGAVLRTHFDLLAAAVLLAALLAFDRRRPVAGMALLGAGTMVKGFPLLLIPIAFAWTWRHGKKRAPSPFLPERIRGRSPFFPPAIAGLLACGAVVLVVSAPFLGRGYLDAYRFHLDRPVQIESTPAVVLYALGGSHVTGTIRTGDEYHSNGLRGGGAGAVESLFAVLAIAVIALLAWLAMLRAEPEHLTLCLMAGVVAFVALGKVFSPQYVAWMAPLAAILLGRRERLAAGLLATAVLLTQFEFPFRYFDLVAGDDGARLLVAVRDLALVATLCVLIARAAAAARSPRPVAAAPPS